MDILKLNTEICSMRPHARQAKVHTIHHLTRTAERFQKKMGPENKRATYEHRAEKLRQEALIIKILKPDEVTKFSLQFDSSLREKVLDDTSIPLSTKAFVRIACHPSVVKAVNEFREKYPDWNKWLENNLEKLGTGSRFGSKMKNGRVKAHLQQRQRVEEAIDTIRRAQMSWLRILEKNKTKSKPEKKTDATKEVTNEKKSKAEDEADSSDSSASESSKTRSSSKNETNSDSNENSDAKTSKDSSSKPAVQTKSKPNTDSKKNKMADKDNSSNFLKSGIILYEEIAENEQESDQEEEDNDNKKKQESLVNKKKPTRKKLAQLKKKDSDSAENASESEDDNLSLDIESENSLDSELENAEDNESEKWTDKESEEADDESDSQKESRNKVEINAKIAKILLKKEKRKKKVIIPRSREVEVCKFSDLLNEEQTKKVEEDDADDDDEDKPSPKSPEKGVDIFFTTRDNDFLRIATAKREAKPEEPLRKGPKWGIEGSEEWTGTRRERRARARRMMGVDDPIDFRRSAPPKLHSPSLFPQRRENILGTPTPQNIPAVPEEPEELHPSWAAKRKMNIASVGFQGKKVKFDDSD